MKLMLNNSIRYNKNNIATNPILKNLNSQKNNPQFRGSFEKIIDKGNGGIVYTNIGEITQKVDDILGENFLRSKFEKLGIDVNSIKDYTVKDSSIITDIYKTVKYPFVDMPVDFVSFLLKTIKKVPFLSDYADKILSADIFTKRTQVIETEKSKDIISNILEAFADKNCLIPNGEKGVVFDAEKCKKLFSTKTAKNLSKTVKNYNSRDERTLNRLITSTVSAVYSSRDFYNISMLQKDNKKDAKRAKKSRFRQEMTRTSISAAMTFLTLGALNKYTKNSLVWTVGTIVGSSLIAEIASRLINKVSLIPLTPKKAQKIAKVKKAKLAKTASKNNEVLNNSPDNKTTKNDVSFKNKILSLNNKTYSAFAGADGTLSPLNMISSSYQKNEPQTNSKTSQKNDHKITKIAGLAFGSASAILLLNYFLKGNIKKSREITKFVTDNHEKLTDYVNGKTTNLDENLCNQLNNLKNSNPKNKVITSFENYCKKIGSFFGQITKKKITYTKEEIISAIDNMKQTEEGAKIKELLEQYREIAERGKDKIQRTEERKLISGLFNGFKKIFDTAWLVLSSPGALIKNGIEKIINKNGYDVYTKASKKLEAENPKASLDGLHKLICKYKNSNECAKMIGRNARLFDTGSETGKIANYSRAFVTMISSYFFINDYYNKVLIESEGKNIHEAQEERNERIAHKLSNFVVNGTLMNIFNSVFVKALNNSLTQATLIAGATEMTNEFLVRKSICQPVRKMKSRDEIIEWEDKQTSKKGLMGAWSRFFKKITGKKTLTEKAHIDIKKEKQEKAKNV